jgi:5-methylcytosine-specific restriction protein A
MLTAPVMMVSSNILEKAQRGNLAVASHVQDGKSLLLFRKTTEGLRFLGEVVYDKHHIEKAPDREGHHRDATVFELRPLSAIVETAPAKTATV